MIAFVRGKFFRKTPAQVIVDVNGVGYEVQISLHTYSFISNTDSGQLFTYLHITENAQTLYGFFGLEEKELFLQLISVSGVGAATARMMLSGMKPEEIRKAIMQGNVKQLESVKGIGKKTAERLILELRDKIVKISGDSFAALADGHNTKGDDALNALLSLGISKPMAEMAVKKVFQNDVTEISVEQIIKLALKNL